MNRPEDNIAREVGRTGEYDLTPMAFGGHCYYVRKSVSGKLAGDDPLSDRQKDGIFLPETVADRSYTVHILAKGPRVGKPCDEFHAKKFDRDLCLPDEIQVGDMVVCPNMHLGIVRSPVCAFEFFIEESVPLYKLEE